MPSLDAKTTAKQPTRGPRAALSASRRRLVLLSAPFAAGPVLLITLEVTVPCFREWAEHHPITTIFVTSGFVVGFTAFLIDQRARLRERERDIDSLVAATRQIGHASLSCALGVAMTLVELGERLTAETVDNEPFEYIKGTPENVRAMGDARREVTLAKAEVAVIAERWRFTEPHDENDVFGGWRALDANLERLVTNLDEFRLPFVRPVASWWWRDTLAYLDAIDRTARQLKGYARSAREGDSELSVAVAAESDEQIERLLSEKVEQLERDYSTSDGSRA